MRPRLDSHPTIRQSGFPRRRGWREMPTKSNGKVRSEDNDA
jgi:hypothetical protein